MYHLLFVLIWIFSSSLSLSFPDIVSPVGHVGERFSSLPPACAEAAVRVPETAGPQHPRDQEDFRHHHDGCHSAHQSEGRVTCYKTGMEVQ